MTSVRNPEWRQCTVLGWRITSGTCVRNDGMSRTVGHETVAGKLVAQHFIAKSVKKLP
jgi:hypothetical protein